jgi:hypothetical protein
MQSVANNHIMLSVVILNITMMSIIMLSVVILNIIMLSVVAPPPEASNIRLFIGMIYSAS